VAGTAGCGGDTKDRLSGLSPDEILRRSTAAASELTAYRLTADGKIQATVTPGAIPMLLTQTLGPGVSFSGEGPVNDDDATFDMDVTLSGLPRLQANVTKVGGGLFVGVVGTDYRVDVPRQQVARVRPARLVEGLLNWAEAPREVGREDVDGTSTVHLAATIADRAVADAAEALSDVAPGLVPPATLRRARAQVLAGVSERAVDMWIGTDDVLPRRITVRLRFAGKVDAFPQLRSASLELDLRISDLGEAVQITAPQTDEVLDLDRLGALAGG